MKKFFLLIVFSLAIFSFSLKAEEDNVFIACDNGLEMFEWDLEIIKEAKQSIEISACFAGGTIFRKLASVLEERMDACPKLQIHFLTTPILLEDEDQKIVAHLEKKFKGRFHLQHSSLVPIVWPDVTGVDNHVKMVVIDETYFSCGGTNFDQSLCSEGTYTPPRNHNKRPPMGPSLPAGARDQDVVGRGPLAVQLRESFYKLYALWEHYNNTHYLEKNPEIFKNVSRIFPIDKTETIFVEKFETSPQKISVPDGKAKFLLSGPHQSKNPISDEYVRLIQEAKEEIIIGNLYFYPTERIFQGLLDASKRGVKITLITNGTGGLAPDFTKYFAWANRIDYVPLLYGRTFHLWESGMCSKSEVKKVKVYEYAVSDILFHKKVMLVDGKKFLIGSYNLGVKSESSDYEIVLSIESEELTKVAKQIIEKDLSYSVEITPKEARGWYFDPFTAYLGEVEKKFHGLI